MVLQQNSPSAVGGAADRIEKIIAWLQAHRDKICCPDKVQVVFDCAGGKISAEIKERVPIS